MMTLTASDTNDTVDLSNITIQATQGDHILFLNGSNDTVNLTGGKEEITDNAGHNTIVLPPPGNGVDDLFGNVLANTLDLRPSLSATSWNGKASTIGNFIQVVMNGSDAQVLVDKRPNAAGTMIADLHGVGSTNLQTLLSHSITSCPSRR